MLLFGAALAVFCVALVRTAWLNDDCFITQRVVDHLRLGFGPRWNISERVQAFTSPAWLAVMTLAELVTHEAFYTLLALGAGVSLAALFVLARRVSPSPELGALALLVLALCPSFVEYSTSGMEQPLAHLLLALLLARAARFDGSPRQLRQAGLLVAALVLTRPDFALLVAPVSVALLQHTRASLRQLALQLVLAASPVLAWELFSLVYYGMLVPNTALAK
ncbi:MAG TPA: glycosyltransferase family 39 protein, partial [Polyangiales bacterium]|nr:glycosyltransferase family 39 protein [Polyangiales bacterium]